jgi:hypothetical protein
MSPFDVEDRRKEIEKISPHHMTALGLNLREERLNTLYKEVLAEIAEGTIDAKSLARAVLGMDR